MNASATLWIIGLVCLIGAVVGQAFKIMGNELPALSSRVARMALAAVGALALALGTVTFLADGTGQTGAQAQPTDRRPATGTPTASPTTTTTVETAAPAVPPAIHWQGLTKITTAGVDFDTNPPSPAGGTGVYAKKDVNVFNLFGGQGVLFAEIGTDERKSKEECIDLLQQQGSSTMATLGNIGKVHACFRTAMGKVGRIMVVGQDSAGLMVDALVWT